MSESKKVYGIVAAALLLWALLFGGTYLVVREGFEPVRVTNSHFRCIEECGEYGCGCLFELDSEDGCQCVCPGEDRE